MKDLIKTPFSSLKNRTGKHKDWFSIDFIKIFCQEINPKNKFFENLEFINQYNENYEKLELKERLNLIVNLLNNFLDMDYKNQLKVLSSLLGKPWPHEEGMFTYFFYLYPISQFIEKHGDKSLDLSLNFIEKLTMQFTGEWAIRPLANLNEKKVLAKMKEWSNHENFHVRRLSSEGLRARLPWGKKINWIEKNPEKSLGLYRKLRNDKVLYVRRSVANSMGDMIKIHEDLAYETMNEWLQKKISKENLWVIKHAIRHPVKNRVKRFLVMEKEIKRLKETI